MIPSPASPAQNLPGQHRWRKFFRILAGGLFIAAGFDHFRNPGFYQFIIPPQLPFPAALVVISGVAEIIGGIGLLVRPLRRAARWGLIALLIAVFPANIYMAVNPNAVPDAHFPQWALWLRLPLQGVLIAWVWWVTGSDNLPENGRILRS